MPPRLLRLRPEGRWPTNAGAVQAGRRHGLSKLPKLVEIINAVPEEHRATLLPQCVCHSEIILHSFVETLRVLQRQWFLMIDRAR